MSTFKQLMKRYRVLVAATMISGYALLSYNFTSDNFFEISKNIDIFATLFRELNIYYVDETKPGDLMKKGIDEMLSSLDPYTNFYPESDIEDVRYMTTGQYGGIGSLIRQKGDYIAISEPYEGYPAQKADLRAGDIILEINGVSAKGKKSDDMSKILKGTPNTAIKMLIQREGEAKPLEKTITREEIKVKSVSYYGMVSNNVGYIKLTGFTENAANEVKDALTELKKNPSFKYLVFDLRGNPGGLLREAVDIVNIFVDKGQLIVSTKGRLKDWEKDHRAINAPVDTQIPMAVLVDRGSASASEIVSGALQDLDRAVVIGQRSFGKGLVQQTRPLSYNTQLKVTVAKYYTPSGRCIQAIDYSHRNEDGSVDKVADSLITAFKTKNGRYVYDGGGIAPDIAVDEKKYSNIAISLSNKGHIFDFATKYRMSHATLSNTSRDFRLSDAEYDDFVASLQGKEYAYTTRSEKALEDLKKAAENDKTFDGMKKEYDILKNKMLEEKKEDLLHFKAEIKQLLEEEIASRYFFQKGRIENEIKEDKEITEAIKVLNDNKEYASILTTITAPNKPLHAVQRESNGK